MRSALGLVFLMGCQVATGLDDLEIQEEPPVAGAPNVVGPVAGGGGTDPSCQHAPDVACNLIEQCGCVAPSVCGVVDYGDTFRVECTTPGFAEIGSRCEGPMDCVAGAVCIRQGDISTCKKPCEQPSDCGSNAVCRELSNFPFAGTCTPTCDEHSDCATNCCAGGLCATASACQNSTKQNGESCAADADCSSNNCLSDKCYGLVPADAPCSDEFDCITGWCVGSTSTGDDGICVDLDPCEDQGVDFCFAKFAVAQCQWNNQCGPAPSSFSACVAAECVNAAAMHTVADCEASQDEFFEKKTCE
jgi:hypothetical protein